MSHANLVVVPRKTTHFAKQLTQPFSKRTLFRAVRVMGPSLIALAFTGLANLAHASSGAMALIGLRMMPTFPWPPLKFRKAGLPRYGFKADLSDGAFLLVLLFKHAPCVHSLPTSLLLSFVSLQTETCLPALSRAGVLSRCRHSSLTTLPQGLSVDRDGDFSACR